MREERRQYFRIDDLVGVSYRAIGKEEAKSFSRDVKENRGAIDYASNFDNRIYTLLDACKVQTPIAADILGLLNKKLNFIISQMDIDSDLIKSTAYTMTEVNISACGMAFAVKELIPVGQNLQLDLMLYPNESQLMLMARVVACEPLEVEDVAESYFLRLAFPDMNHTDQELLIQHVVKKQSKQLNVNRRNSEDWT